MTPYKDQIAAIIDERIAALPEERRAAALATRSELIIIALGAYANGIADSAELLFPFLNWSAPNAAEGAPTVTQTLARTIARSYIKLLAAHLAATVNDLEELSNDSDSKR